MYDDRAPARIPHEIQHQVMGSIEDAVKLAKKGEVALHLYRHAQ
ncbi:hypothetical protein P4S73_16395 [Paraglaciecola sp. Hal342]